MTQQESIEPAALLQAVLDSPGDLVIFALDREYRYVAFNESHRATIQMIWGVDIRLGMDMLAEVVRRDDDREKAKVLFDRALSGERIVSYEAYGDDQLARKTFESAYSPMRSPQGAVIGVSCVVRDVSQAQHTEHEREQLRSEMVLRNEELLQSSQENAQLVERLRIAVSELTTPVLEVWDSVLVMPIVGIVDTERGEQMTTRLLDAIERHRARFVIIDLTGVGNLDTSTANRFFQLARAAKLLGSEAIIAGIQSAVAQTLVALGVDLSGLQSTRNLKQALELCISRLRDSGAPMTSRSQTKSPAAFFPSSRSGKSKDSGGSGLG